MDSDSDGQKGELSVRRDDASVTDLDSRRGSYEQLKSLLGLNRWHLETAVIESGSVG